MFSMIFGTIVLVLALVGLGTIIRTILPSSKRLGGAIRKGIREEYRAGVATGRTRGETATAKANSELHKEHQTGKRPTDAN